MNAQCGRSAALLSRQTQKSLTKRNVWVGWRSLVMSEFVFWKSEAEKQWTNGEKREGREVGREGNSLTPERR